MDSELETLLQRVLAMPAKARAELAHALLDSLERDVEKDAEAAWEVEIARRIAQLDSGGIAPIPWSVARRSLRRS